MDWMQGASPQRGPHNSERSGLSLGHILRCVSRRFQRFEKAAFSNFVENLAVAKGTRRVTRSDFGSSPMHPGMFPSHFDIYQAFVSAQGMSSGYTQQKLGLHESNFTVWGCGWAGTRDNQKLSHVSSWVLGVT